MGNLNLQTVTASQTQKETTINAIAAQLENAITERTSYAWTGSDASKTASVGEFRESVIFIHTGSTSDGDPDFIVPAVERGIFGVDNQIGQDITVGTSGQATPPVAVDGEVNLFYCDGTSAFKFAGGSGVSTFVALSDTPANFTSANRYIARVNTGATAIEFIAPIYEIGASFGGAPTASLIVFAYVATRALDFPTNLAVSKFIAKVAATASTVFDVQKNGVSIGSATFAIAGTVATFVVTATSLAAGDRLEVVAPASPDATLADLIMTFVATRGD